MIPPYPAPSWLPACHDMPPFTSFSPFPMKQTKVLAIQRELTSQFSSVTQSRPPLCNPMDGSTPGFPVHHQLPELTSQPSLNYDGHFKSLLFEKPEMAIQTCFWSNSKHRPVNKSLQTHVSNVKKRYILCVMDSSRNEWITVPTSKAEEVILGKTLEEIREDRMYNIPADTSHLLSFTFPQIQFAKCPFPNWGLIIFKHRS